MDSHFEEPQASLREEIHWPPAIKMSEIESSFLYRLITSEKIPDSIRCPLSLEVMKEPVLMGNRVYERKFIAKWVVTNNVDPISRLQCSIKDIRPDFGVRKMVSFYLEQIRNGDLIDRQLLLETQKKNSELQVNIELAQAYQTNLQNELTKQRNRSASVKNCLQKAIKKLITPDSETNTMSSRVIQREYNLEDTALLLECIDRKNKQVLDLSKSMSSLEDENCLLIELLSRQSARVRSKEKRGNHRRNKGQYDLQALKNISKKTSKLSLHTVISKEEENKEARGESEELDIFSEFYWHEGFDPIQSHYYYYNILTEEATWTKPNVPFRPYEYYSEEEDDEEINEEQISECDDTPTEDSDSCSGHELQSRERSLDSAASEDEPQVTHLQDSDGSSGDDEPDEQEGEEAVLEEENMEGLRVPNPSSSGRIASTPQRGGGVADFGCVSPEVGDVETDEEEEPHRYYGYAAF